VAILLRFAAHRHSKFQTKQNSLRRPKMAHSRNPARKCADSIWAKPCVCYGAATYMLRDHQRRLRQCFLSKWRLDLLWSTLKLYRIRAVSLAASSCRASAIARKGRSWVFGGNLSPNARCRACPAGLVSEPCSIPFNCIFARARVRHLPVCKECEHVEAAVSVQHCHKL